MTRKAIKISTYIMAPIMMGLAVCAKPLVSLLLTDKWIACVPFIRIFCITYMFYPIHTANLNAIKAMGRSDMFLRLEIAKKMFGFILLILTMKNGVMVMAYSLLVASVINQIINSWPNRELLDYSYFEQIRDIFPSLILSIVMSFFVYLIGYYMPLSTNFTLMIQVVCGILIYIILSIVFKLDEFRYLLKSLKILKK